MPPSVLGLDIGGANLKAAHSAGTAYNQPFELWKAWAELPGGLRALQERFPPFDRLAVTMTGELCDCFETKKQGVCAILDAVVSVAGTVPVLVWQTDGRFVNLEAAREAPLLAAAANWLALATFAGRYVPAGPALLLDVGSTTTDIVPLLDGRPVPRARTDTDRLRSGELVYTGVRRTPVCVLLGSAGAAEFFATTQDVYRVLGEVDQDPTDCQTADGRPATTAFAQARLARMICADLETARPEQVFELARHLRDLQISAVRRALARVAAGLPDPPRAAVIAGSGEFLARAVLRGTDTAPVRIISLASELGPSASRAATAYAVAVLAAENLGEGV
jgi:probable H4MPT-linked C1 transfer pathway protein